MALIKTEAILIRTAKMGETSKLLTLYSLKFGIIKLVAKGARSFKSRTGGTLEPLHILEVVYYHKTTRELQILSQTSVIFAPKNIFKDPEKMMMASACGEIVYKTAAMQQTNIPLFNLLKNTIISFERVNSDPRILLLAFRLQLLSCVGLQPGLTACTVCLKKTSANWYFEAREAKLICEECAGSHPKYTEKFPQAILRSLQCICSTPILDILEGSVPKQHWGEIYKFTNTFYHYHLEETKNLKSLQVLQQMKAFNLKKE